MRYWRGSFEDLSVDSKSVKYDKVGRRREREGGRGE